MQNSGKTDCKQNPVTIHEKSGNILFRSVKQGESFIWRVLTYSMKIFMIGIKGG